MNRKLKPAALAAALLVPTLSFAQPNNGPATRAQVRSELAQLVKAGYRPGGRGTHYPADLWAAQARVAAQAASYPGQPAPAMHQNGNGH